MTPRLTIPPNPKARSYLRGPALKRLQWIETALRYGEHVSAREFAATHDVSQPAFVADLSKFVDLVQRFGGEASRERGQVDIVEWPEEGVVGTIHPLDWLAMRDPEALIQIGTATLGQPNLEAMTALCSAILSRSVIEIEDLARDRAARRVTFSPSLIICADGLYSLRGFNHFTNSYEEIPTGRIATVITAPSRAYVDLEQDQEWNEYRDVTLHLRDDLTPGARRTACLDYGLSPRKPHLSLRYRTCLFERELRARGLDPIQGNAVFRCELSQAHPG